MITETKWATDMSGVDFGPVTLALSTVV